MGFVIPGGAQGAQHSGGAAMAVLISTMLAGRVETLHTLHMYTCRTRVSQPCLRTAPAPCMQISHSAKCSQSKARHLPSIAPVVQCWRQEQGARLCWEDQEQRAPVCVVLEGWLNSLASTHHCSFTALCHRKTQDGNYSETSQKPHWQKPWISQSWGRAQWHSSVRGFEEK